LGLLPRNIKSIPAKGAFDIFFTIKLYEMLIQPIYNLAVTGFLVLWFIITVICQFKGKPAQFLRRHVDLLNIIPQWTFFAPSPGKSDYHLLYRDKNTDEIISEWTELDIVVQRNWFNFIWNPQKRKKKILADIVQSLVAIIAKHEGNNEEARKLLMFTLPYVMVLNTIFQEDSKIDDPYYRQFMLAESSGYLEDRDPSFILVSKFHQIK
jgi:hypothetical protein